jgi:hypothetical protein
MTDVTITNDGDIGVALAERQWLSRGSDGFGSV